eukprot:11303294-Prorocentrum_lima.AAC.1
MVLHVTKPLISEHAACTHTLKDAENTLKYYIGEASFAWLDTLKAMLQTLADLRGLARCGLTVSFVESLRQLPADSPEVQLEDSIAC